MGLYTTEEKEKKIRNPFGREEKFNKETGKWEIEKKGLSDYKPKIRKSSPVYDKLKPQVKAIKKKERDAKWKKRKETYKRVSKGVNSVLDAIEGKPPKKNYSKPKPRKKQYVVQNGMAYPVYRPHQKKKTTKKKKSRSNDPFDLKVYW